MKVRDNQRVSARALENLSSSAACQLRWESSELAEISLEGNWDHSSALPCLEKLKRELEAHQPAQLKFSSHALGKWNSVLLIFVSDLRRWAERQGSKIDLESLPSGVQQLLKLADASPESEGNGLRLVKRKLWERMENQFLRLQDSFVDLLDFLGRVVMVFVHLAKGCARFRSVDLIIHMKEAGAKAVPIIALIAFLMGLILAYVGAVQLARFGATIFVADLVAIAIVREMGPIMTAIVMAGRTGAAFAAQLGTMKVNQEIDAYKTMAISPYQFLVLPRLLALCLMMPLLGIFANAIGILGGGVVAKLALDMSWIQFFLQAQGAIGPIDIWISLIKCFVFGIIVAFFGCYRGMNSGENALAVGQAATSAVVSSLVFIIIADAIFAIMMGVLGI